MHKRSTKKMNKPSNSGGKHRAPPTQAAGGEVGSSKDRVQPHYRGVSATGEGGEEGISRRGADGRPAYGNARAKKGNGGRLARLVDTLSGRHLRPARRRLLGLLVSILILALLMCLLVLLQAFANFDAFFSTERENAAARKAQSAQDASVTRPKSDREIFFENAREEQRRWLAGAPPPEQGGSDATGADSVGGGAIPTYTRTGMRPSYLPLALRQHPYFTTRMLHAMAEEAASGDAGAEAVIPTLLPPEHDSNADHAKDTKAEALAFTREELSEADRSLEDALHYLLPPHQRAAHLREALDSFLAIGPRPVREAVWAANRQRAIEYMANQGLGRHRFTPASLKASAALYVDAPHLSELGKRLLLHRVHTAAQAEDVLTTTATATASALEAVEGGWWWSLAWDNFSETVPPTVNNAKTRATFHNMVFHFAGGSRFRSKAAAAAASAMETEALSPAKERAPWPMEVRGFAQSANPAYEQESFVRLAGDDGAAGAQPRKGPNAPGGYAQVARPLMETAEPAGPHHRAPDKAVYSNGKVHARRTVTLTASQRATPLKASLAASRAAPLVKQPLTHVAFAAHWDTMPEETIHKFGPPPRTAAGREQPSQQQTAVPFLGACDSAVPVLFALRKMKNVAALSDAAEAVAALYLEEYQRTHGNVAEQALPADAVIPGVTTLFKDAPAADVARHLRQVLSPAHYALLYHYYFVPWVASGNASRGHDGTAAAAAADGEEETFFAAHGFTDGRRRASVLPAANAQHAAHLEADATFALDEDHRVDPRALLDWVQHLPAITVFLFDGEEALRRWSGTDNTYGSRHLAARWATVPAEVTRPAAFVRTPRATALRETLATLGRTTHGRREVATLMDDLDLFLLYDLLGPPSTTLHNLFPTHSGIFYAELARVERARRRRAFAHSHRVSQHLVAAVVEHATADAARGHVRANGTAPLVSRVLSLLPATPSGSGRLITGNTSTAKDLFDGLARSLHLDALHAVAGSFLPQQAADAVAHSDGLDAITTCEEQDLDYGRERAALWPRAAERDDEEPDRAPEARGAAMATPDLLKELYAPIPKAWRLFGSPHDMFTLHAVARSGDRDVHRALDANPQLRTFHMMNPAVYMKSIVESVAQRHTAGTPSRGEGSPERTAAAIPATPTALTATEAWDQAVTGVARKKLREGVFYSPFGHHAANPMEGFQADDNALQYLQALVYQNKNVFFPLDQAALAARLAFQMAVDDDHKHWLDSQRVLHLISVPFPPAWHTPYDHGASIDDGTMSDMWSIFWDFTLLLGEYWETQAS